MSQGQTTRTARVATVVVVLAALLGACDAAPAPTPSSTGTPVAGKESDVRTRLADALATDRPDLARLLADESVTLTPVPTPWLPGRQILDVLADTGSHPVRFYVALSDEGDAVVLTRDADAFVGLLADADVRVPDEQTAVDVVDTYLDATRSFQVWSQRVGSLDEIELLLTLDADQQAAWDAVVADLGADVAPTRAANRGDGFDVVAWVADGDTLVRHDVRVTEDGGLSDRTTVLATGLPVPVSP